jgi:hypothetical protein
MRTLAALVSLCIVLTGSRIAAAESASASAELSADSAGSSSERTDKAIAPEFGGGGGVDIPTGGLGLGPAFFIEGGARFRLGPGSLVAALRIGFQTFSTSVEGSSPCPSPEACVAADNGRYAYDLNEQALLFGLPVSYRFLPPDAFFNPYIGVAPTLFLLKATSTAFELENTETGTQFGVAALLGGQVRLGPGALFLEVGFQYAGLSHRITGESNLGAITTALGYRVML